MEVKGIGVDIMEIERIEELMERYKKRAKIRLFTKAEIEYCERHRNKYENYSARFAAKEAMMKALGVGIGSGIRWIDIEIKNKEHGEPFIILHRKALEKSEEMGVKSIYLSLSHNKKMAVAFVILSGDDLKNF